MSFKLNCKSTVPGITDQWCNKKCSNRDNYNNCPLNLCHCKENIELISKVSNKNLPEEIWYAENYTKISLIEIQPYDIKKNIYYFNFPIPHLDFKKHILADGTTVSKKFNYYYLFPYWKLYYNNIEFKKDNKEIYNYLIDSLLEYQPVLVFSSNKCKFNTNLISASFNDAYNDRKGYYLKLLVQLDKPYLNIPKKIRNVKIVIKSMLLPENKYLYGRCVKINGRFYKCTRKQYMTKSTVGGKKNSLNLGCSVFILEKGNPNVKCSFIMGT